jgi:hypothetical protein
MYKKLISRHFFFLDFLIFNELLISKMKSKIIILLFISILKIQGQYKIEGRFEGLAGKSIQLTGFNSFKNYEINTTTVSSNGSFDFFLSSKIRQ